MGLERMGGVFVIADEQYFNIACKRIEQAYSQPDMFVEAEKQPTAEQLAMAWESP